MRRVKNRRKAGLERVRRPTRVSVQEGQRWNGPTFRASSPWELPCSCRHHDYMRNGEEASSFANNTTWNSCGAGHGSGQKESTVACLRAQTSTAGAQNYASISSRDIKYEAFCKSPRWQQKTAMCQGSKSMAYWVWQKRLYKRQRRASSAALNGCLARRLGQNAWFLLRLLFCWIRSVPGRAC